MLAADDVGNVDALAQFGSPRLQHPSIGRSASFSPDGKRIATTGTNFVISIWDVSSGKQLETLQSTGSSARDLRWKSDGKLAWLTEFRDVFLMQESVPGSKADPKKEAQIEALTAKLLTPPSPADRPQRGRLVHHFLANDGEWAVAVRNRADKPVQWAEVYKFEPGQTSDPAKAVARVELSSLPPGHGPWLSNDGQWLLVPAKSAADNRLLAFDLKAKNLAKPTWEVTLNDRREGEAHSCVSLNGKEVVIQFVDGAVELWDGPNGKRLREFPKLPLYYHQGVNGEWGGLDLSADGKRLALLNRRDDGRVGGQIVEVQTGKDICSLRPQPMPIIDGGTYFSPDGRLVARVGRGVVRIWNADTGEDACPLPGHRASVTSLGIAGDGKTVVTTGRDFTVRAWSSKSGEELWQAALPEGGSIQFATADTVVVAQPLWNARKPALLFDLTNGKSKPLPGKLGDAKRAYPLAISADGKNVATITHDMKPNFQIFSWPQGEELKQIPVDPPGKWTLNSCTSAQFSSDGKQLVAVVYYDDPTEQQTRRQVPAHPFIERWDLATGKLLGRVEPGKGYSLQLLPWRDGIWVWTSDNEIRDAITGKLVIKPQFPEGEVYNPYSQRAAVSVDGKIFAIAVSPFDPGAAGMIMFFEVEKGKLIRSERPGGDDFAGVQFLPDGRLISLGVTAQVWAAVAPRKE
jgi:WD40 repeat protein